MHMDLFKFCKYEHLRAVLDTDTLRIGTVFDWRRNGTHGEMVYDSEDVRISLPASNFVIYDWRFIDALDPKYEVKATGSGVGREARMKALEVGTHDRYVYSAASNYSDTDHARWAEAQGYNACFRISDAESFFSAISEALTDATFELAHEALYVDDAQGNLVFEETFHPALLKRV